jgi:leader peptidase (prepilin peptidase)/N-methyltransferase
MIAVLHLTVGLGVLIIGAAVGSFLNVCIYRIPWQKSLLWPDSRCPRCLGSIAPRDNIPVLSWLMLRGECRRCGAPISPRYPAVEALVALLFFGVYVTDVVLGPGGITRALTSVEVLRMAYHMLLVALLVVATFIDYDLYIIPDAITVPWMIVGLVVGTIVPGIRPAPATAMTPLGGFWAGLAGLLVGGGIIWAIRIGGVVIAWMLGREEAMGFGDVTLMALVGTFLGWQAAVLTVFLAAFLGLVPALVRLSRIYFDLLVRGKKYPGSYHEIPFGPYLSAAAIVLLLAWPWLWERWAGPYFANLGAVVWFLLGQDV